MTTRTWAKVGIGSVVALLLVLVGLVVASPSPPSQSVTPVPLPPPTVAETSTTLATTTSVAPLGSPATQATVPDPQPSAAPTTDDGSRPARCVDPDDCPSAGAQTVDRGLRNATPGETTAIAGQVAFPPGEKVDSVMISISDPTWGVLHVVAVADHGQTYVLVRLVGGKWAPVDSGYPRLRCDEAVPAEVLIDLGSVGTLCP
jgi:hypothetical protein